MSERLKIIIKNIFFVAFLVALMGFYTSVGIVVALLSAVITSYLSLNTQNGFIKDMINGRRPKNYFLKIAVFSILISVSFSGSRTYQRFTQGIEYNNKINDNLEYQDSEDSSEVKVTIIHRRDEGSSIDIISEFRRLEILNDAYFGTDEYRKATIERVQKKLKELGYYKGTIDGIDGPLTKKAVVAYKKDTYVYNEEVSIDEYATEFISIQMLKDL
jgi:hypothetical protein